MSRCLTDRALWSVRDGDATPAEWAHLTGCPACASRHRQLARDLSLIRRALEGPEPVMVAPPRLSSLRLRLAPAAGVAFALVGALVLGDLWGRSHELASAPPAPREDVVAFLEDVSTALFPTATADSGEVTASDQELSELQAALEGQTTESAGTRRKGS
jgi:anti-sigma factor RsiW